jgi:hypothetical protein
VVNFGDFTCVDLAIHPKHDTLDSNWYWYVRKLQFHS